MPKSLSNAPRHREGQQPVYSAGPPHPEPAGTMTGRKASYATTLAAACQPQRSGLAARPGGETTVAWALTAIFRIGTVCSADKHLGTAGAWEGAKNSTAGNGEAFSKSSGSCYSSSMDLRTTHRLALEYFPSQRLVLRTSGGRREASYIMSEATHWSEVIETAYPGGWA